MPLIDAGIDDAARPDASPARPAKPMGIAVDRIAVSSRVDNATESPSALADGNLDTAWSSQTGDLEGAWVALFLRYPADVTAVLLTVGMTKDPGLFVQNPRISDVSISWAPLGPKDAIGPANVVVAHAVLDIESRALQRIPVNVPGHGVLTITVKKLTMGTKANWREVTMSEVALEGPGGARLGIDLWSALVGSFDPKPRGALGIVPERDVPLGCKAVLIDKPRFYCFLGSQMGGSAPSATGELVTVDSAGFTSVAPLDDGKLPYDAWLRAERSARSARPLTGEKEIPWQGTLDLGGAVLRQTELKREHVDTSVGNWDLFEGALEIRWPGAADFTRVFEDSANTTSPNDAYAVRVGNSLLVERGSHHASEGMSWDRADAALCDVTMKTCLVYAGREADAEAP